MDLIKIILFSKSPIVLIGLKNKTSESQSIKTLLQFYNAQNTHKFKIYRQPAAALQICLATMHIAKGALQAHAARHASGEVVRQGMTQGMICRHETLTLIMRKDLIGDKRQGA